MTMLRHIIYVSISLFLFVEDKVSCKYISPQFKQFYYIILSIYITHQFKQFERDYC